MLIKKAFEVNLLKNMSLEIEFGKIEPSLINHWFLLIKLETDN